MVAQPVSQPRAAIYIRVSTDRQGDNYSLPTQEATCREYAAAQGYTVVDVYRETHTGTELWERPALAVAREAMRRGAFDVFICYDPDRFSRKQTHAGVLLDICERAGVELRFAMFDFTRDPTGQFLLNARVFAAELEREKILERTQRGMVARVKSGKLVGRAQAPFGYRYTDATRGALEEDPDTAWIVRDIFAQADAGMPLRRIEVGLNERGIRPPGRAEQWRPTSVYAILTRPAYAGRGLAFTTVKRRIGGKVVRLKRPPEEWVELPEGVVPALVDPALSTACRPGSRRTASPRRAGCASPRRSSCATGTPSAPFAARH
jgi:site-specific DNA recombinase